MRNFLDTDITLDAFADILINLSAGWFATIFIFPGIWQSTYADLLWRQLIYNLVSSILSFTIAILMKMEVKHHEY